MTSREFSREVMDRIPDYLPPDMRGGLNLSMHTVVKVNDQELNGLIFGRDDSNTAPTFYLNDAFREYENGRDIGEIASGLASAYMDTRDMTPVMQQMETKDLSYDKVRDDITLRLVEVKRNRHFLQERPYMSVGNGLALVCDIQMRNAGGAGLVGITNDMAEANGYDRQTLFDNALADADKHQSATLTDMQGVLFRESSDNLLEGDNHISREDLSTMYVLSNQEATYGAASLFYPGVQEKIADVIGDNYFALPSSLHEFIIVPESSEPDPEALSAMVKEANRSSGVIDPKDVLSDQVLKYSRDTKSLEPAVADKERGSRVAEAR